MSSFPCSVSGMFFLSIKMLKVFFSPSFSGGKKEIFPLQFTLAFSKVGQESQCNSGGIENVLVQVCAERKPIISEHSFRKFVFSVFQGAFTFQGSMIDMPLLKQAQNIVTLATSIKEKWSVQCSSHQVGWTYTVGFLKTHRTTQGTSLSMPGWDLPSFTVHINHDFFRCCLTSQLCL